MRKAAMIGAVLLLAGCGGDEGSRAERSFEAGGFDRVALRGSHDVQIAVGGAHSVRAEGPQRRLDRLEIVVEDGELRISEREGGRDGSWFFGGGRGVTIHVTLPALAAAAVTGSGDMRIDRVEGERFEGSVRGSGDMEVGSVRVREARFAVTGSGDLRAEGSAERAEAQVRGSGDVELERLEARSARIAIAGSGDVTIRATETAEVELRGSGDATVFGSARCTIDKRGSGEVRCNR